MSRTCDMGPRSARSALALRARNLRQLTDSVRAEEMEGIHQMRVASRRLRAALKEFAPVTGTSATSFEDQVRAVTGDLGRARELDVMMGMLTTQRKKAPGEVLPSIAYVLRQLRRRRQAESPACHRCADRVASEACAQSLRLLLDGLTPTETCHLDYVRRRLLKREKSLRKQFERWEDKDREPLLHQVRIGFKKLRYACEVHEEHYGPDMAAYLRDLKKVQQLLGDWNDCRLLRDEITHLADGAPRDARRALPALTRYWDSMAADHLRKFHKKAPRFFDKKHSRRARRLFSSPEADCACRVKSTW